MNPIVTKTESPGPLGKGCIHTARAGKGYFGKKEATIITQALGRSAKRCSWKSGFTLIELLGQGLLGQGQTVETHSHSLMR